MITTNREVGAPSFRAPCEDGGMRVVVATDSVGSMSSAAAGTQIARGWTAAEVAVVPLGDSGTGFASAIADQLGVEVTLLPRDAADPDGAPVTCVDADGLVVVTVEPAAGEPAAGIDGTGSSWPLGRALRRAIEATRQRPSTVVIDLAWARTHDGGAGLLAGLGATADVDLTAGVDALAALTRIDLAPVRALLDGVQLVGVVPQAQLERHLLGLRGITSMAGREVDEHPERMLAVDDSLKRFAALCAPALEPGAGAGACGGTGFAIQALGGELRTGAAWSAERIGLARTIGQADLVVTGCGVFDFATRGGGVVAEVARLAGEALRPCIAITGELLIGSREMRTMGIESAYPVGTRDVTAPALAETAARIARSWSW